MTTINGIGGTGGPTQPGEPGEPGEPRKAVSKGGVEQLRSDQVHLSADARHLASLAKTAGSLPEIRTERIEALRTAVVNGSYDPDPRAVARAILEFEDGLPF